MFTKRKRFDLNDLKSRDPRTLAFDERVLLMMEPVERDARERYEASQPPLFWVRLWSLAMAVQIVAILVGSVAIVVALFPVFTALVQIFNSISIWVAAGSGAVVVATQFFFRRTKAPAPWW